MDLEIWKFKIWKLIFIFAIFLIFARGVFADKINGLVVLASDLGTQDFYVGAVKGAIYSKFFGVDIDEISLVMPPSNVREASYILANAASEFPRGTVFCILVDPTGPSGKSRAIAVETEDEKFYVAPDNGVLTLVMRRAKIVNAREVTNSIYLHDANALTSMFPGRDIYGPAAGALAKGTALELLGSPAKDLVTFPIADPKLDKGELSGEVAHITSSGNIVTNIPQELVTKLGALSGKALSIDFGSSQLDAPFVKGAADAKQGNWYVSINNLGTLEVARNQASANAILQVHAGTLVKIRLTR